ncbi:hypothetical protein [Methylomonas sp. AM2-LC]|uniref:hypothetical protein n=1 Tax=Methylomonas sp. AM2-LC TaxID=3153301 RepID=UPI0032644969
MRNKAIILSSLLFLASGNSMAQSFLNSATQAVENAGEQAVVNAAPAPVQQGVNAINQAQQLNNLSNGATGLTNATGLPTTVTPPTPTASGVVNAVEGEAKQEAAQKALNLLQ